MRNKDNAHALLLELPYNLKQSGCFAFIQGGGRLIQNEDFSIYIHSSGDSHHLLDCYRVIIQCLVYIDIHIKLLQKLDRPSVDFLPVNEAKPARLPANKNVLCHSQVRTEIDLLIYGGNALLLRLLRSFWRNLPAIQMNCAPVLRIYTCQHLDQG